ncbi:GNAT family N-acetyltransferase [Paenibacillus turpanensis]|uniref:GNAT family N-acetyltransferase n=1 Tax=Paenibacillus turpanensis TaxID=2689078 RepID=UPI001408AD39|nr:GNAT family N-acetyltransferase [Paenibacillus turpanensis]
MNIRVLQEHDAEAYQALRLAGLQCDPDAFGSTYEREAAFSLETVVDRIRPTEDKFVLGAFMDDGSLAGIVTFVRESGMKMKHKGNVYGMYVSAQARGAGVGKALLLALIKMSRNYEGLEQLNLTVTSTNEAAKRLYQSVGFESYGIERRALKFNDVYFDEDLMVYRLN